MTFYLNSDRGRASENIQLFHPNSGRLDLRIKETNLRDPLGEGLNKPYVTGIHDGPDLVRHFLVIHHPRQIVRSDGTPGHRPGAIILHREIDIDAHSLGRGMLPRMHPDASGLNEVTQEHVADATGAVGDADVLHRHSSGAAMPWPGAH